MVDGFQALVWLDLRGQTVASIATTYGCTTRTRAQAVGLFVPERQIVGYNKTTGAVIFDTVNRQRLPVGGVDELSDRTTRRKQRTAQMLSNTAESPSLITLLWHVLAVKEAWATGPLGNAIFTFTGSDGTALGTYSSNLTCPSYTGETAPVINTNGYIRGAGSGGCYYNVTQQPTPVGVFASYPDFTGTTNHRQYLGLYESGQGTAPTGVEFEMTENSAGTDTAILYQSTAGSWVAQGATINQEFADGNRAHVLYNGDTVVIDYYNGTSWAELTTRSVPTTARRFYGALACGTGNTIRGDDWGLSTGLRTVRRGWRY
jgi:hypothetical protein